MINRGVSFEITSRSLILHRMTRARQSLSNAFFQHDVATDSKAVEWSTT